MSQKRLNHLIICAIHQEDLDDFYIEELAKEFALRNTKRETIVLMPK